MDYEGKIIEFQDGDAVKLAYVNRVQGKKLQIVDENGKQQKLNEKLVLNRHDKQTDAASFRSLAGELKQTIDKVCDELDLELLWEEASEDPGRFHSTDELAAMYFGEASSLEVGALCRKLLADPARFRFKNQQFAARSAEDIERELQAEKKRREREERERQVRKWIRRLMHADEIVEIPEHLENFVQMVEAAMLLGHSNEALELIETVSDDDAVSEEIAFEILVKTAKVNPGSDAILTAAGLSRDFEPATVEYADTLSEFTEIRDREDFTKLLTFSIDDDDTTEIDDAISFEQVDGVIRVGVHIADLSHFVKQKDPVDEEALRRCATVYMPTGAVHMIPQRISCDLASLNQGELRPSFSTIIDFSQDGEILDWRICRGAVNVDHRLNYEESDELIDSGEGELADALRTLDRILKPLTEGRLHTGAMIFSKYELKVRVNDDEIDMRGIYTFTPSRNIIAELMIQTNRLSAEFAEKNNIPIIFRAQVPPDSPARRYMGQVVEETNPNVFRGLKKSRLSLHPQPHSGLGLKAYTQVSSPLRRFGDLVMQRQIAAFLNKSDYPYTSTGLLEVIGNAEVVERENRAIERRATRFWELEFLRREGEDKVYDGTVMSKLPGAYMVALSPYPIRGRMPAKGMLKFGSSIKVRLAALNPQLSIIRLEQVQEEVQEE